jgi:hypothetical protein
MKLLRTGLALGMLAAPVAWASATEQDDTAAKVQSAKTATDHEALAAHYEKLAADARKEAATHTQMAKTYGTGSSGGKGSWVAMPQHCTNIAKNLEATAKEYDAMAAAHHEAAKAAGK